MRINYPSTFRNMSADDTQAYLKLWSVSFKDYPYIEVANAVNAIIQTDTREFAPNVAIVKKQINKKYISTTTNDGEAWEQVLMACSCNPTKARKNYENLSKNIQRALGGSYMLVDIGNCTKDNIGFLRDKFLSRYVAVQEEEVNELTIGTISQQEFLEHDTKGGPEEDKGLQKLDFKALLGSGDV